MSSNLWQSRFRALLWLGIISLFGLAILVPSTFTHEMPPTPLLLTGLLLFVPGAIYSTTVTIWHWKSRYRGKHSDLWGALMLLEVSGWFRLDNSRGKNLAIILNELPDPFQTQVNLLKLTWNFDTRVEPHPFDARDFSSLNPVIKEILRTGIEISV